MGTPHAFREDSPKQVNRALTLLFTCKN